MGLLILLPGWFSIPHNQFRYPGPVLLLSPPHHWKIQQLLSSFNENLAGFGSGYGKKGQTGSWQFRIRNEFEVKLP
jgi:hypothetical protein